MARNSPLKYCLKEKELVGVALATTDGTRDTPTDLELEIVRVFTEWHKLQAENKEIKEKYQAYTTGKAKNYHDVWCSASRDEPMGCLGCSCTIGKKIKALQAENKRLESENLKLKNTVLGVYNHLRKHHYSGAFYKLEPLLDEIMEQTSIDK